MTKTMDVRHSDPVASERVLDSMGRTNVQAARLSFGYTGKRWGELSSDPPSAGELLRRMGASAKVDASPREMTRLKMEAGRRKMRDNSGDWTRLARAACEKGRIWQLC